MTTIFASDSTFLQLSYSISIFFQLKNHNYLSILIIIKYHYINIFRDIFKKKNPMHSPQLN